MKKIITLLFVFVFVQMSFGQFSGSYNIGSGQTYTTLKAACDALNTAGTITGNCTFYITSDLTETAPVVLTVNTSTYTLTFKPAASVTPTITFSGLTTTGATAYSGFTLNGTSSVIIDGSNTVGGTTKDLTFKMNDGTNGRMLIQLYGNCDNVTIKNIVVSYQSPMNSSTSTRGIYLNGQSTGACDNFTVQNCDIGDATNTPYYAIAVTGSSGSAIYCTNVIIKNNNIYGRIRPIYFYYVGTASTTSEISNNNIYAYGGVSGSSTYYILYSIWAGTINIFNNKMPVMTSNNSAASLGMYGVSGLTAATGSIANIYNNFLGGNVAASGSALPVVISLMYIQDIATSNIYQNTLYYPSITNQATERSCIHISGSTAIVNLKNNIIINDNDAATAYCIWKSNGTLTSDHNDLLVTGATSNIGYVGAAAYQTLANWQAAGFSYDANSKSVSVTFSNAANGDLHLAGASNGDINLIGDNTLGILKDIDGDTRSVTYPYMGADEASAPLPVELTSFVSTVSGKSVILEWKTATELNSNGYEIERINKNDGTTNSAWKEIAFVKGAGNSYSQKQYSFSDNSLQAGKYQYRLKIIDNNGSFKYSQVTETEVIAPAEFILSQNYPNPFNPVTTIKYSLPIDCKVMLSVYSITGQKVAELINKMQTAGEYNIQFNANGLASGTYIYRLQAGTFVQTKKMIILK